MTFFNSVPKSNKETSKSKHKKKYKVLIVDDNEIELLVLRASLNQHVVTTFASSAQQALTSLRSQVLPDLIILDIVMPDINGFEFCQTLKQDYHTKNIPIIFLSGKNDWETKAKAFEAGAVDYVTKPFIPEELEYRIQNQLRLIDERERLEGLAYTDELTGLPNRRAYNQALQSEWSRCMRHKQAISLLILDIDNFKEYNDIYGHDAGDIAIKKVADAFSTLAIRAGDMCARFGGEELVLVLPECNEVGLASKANEAVSLISRMGIEHSRSAHSKIMTVSIGAITAYPSPDLDSLAFFKLCDDALYRSKSHGKNQYHIANTMGEAVTGDSSQSA